MDSDVREFVNVAMTRVMYLQGVEPSQQVILSEIYVGVQILNFIGEQFLIWRCFRF